VIEFLALRMETIELMVRFGSFSDSQVSTAQFGQKLKSIVQ